MDTFSRIAAAPDMDWARVRQALRDSSGVLVPVGRVTDAEPLAAAMNVSLRPRPRQLAHAVRHMTS